MVARATAGDSSNDAEALHLMVARHNHLVKRLRLYHCGFRDRTGSQQRAARGTQSQCYSRDLVPALMENSECISMLI
jgi:hypothetical protein